MIGRFVGGFILRLFRPGLVLSAFAAAAIALIALSGAIVGGAPVPPLFRPVADAASLRAALLVPVVCCAVIAGFGIWAAHRPGTATKR